MMERLFFYAKMEGGEMSETKDKITILKSEDISDFPNHPYKVETDDELLALAQNIKENGMINPTIVRKMEDGSCQMIARAQKKKGK